MPAPDPFPRAVIMPDLLLELRSEEIPAKPRARSATRREDAQKQRKHAGGEALMPDLLLELRSEEIPARMQRKAAGDLKKMVTDGLVEAGLTYEAAREYWTPRRLALDVRGLTARSKDVQRGDARARAPRRPSRRSRASCASAGLSSISRGACPFRSEEGRFLRRPIFRSRAGRRKRSSPT